MEHELFQPFTQEKADARTQYKGTGLGMSIVKGLIDRMNGTISVRSTPGEGVNSHSGWHFVWQKRKGSRRLIIRKTRKMT